MDTAAEFLAKAMKAGERRGLSQKILMIINRATHDHQPHRMAYVFVLGTSPP